MPHTVKVKVEDTEHEVELGEEQVQGIVKAELEGSDQYMPVGRHKAEMAKLRDKSKGMVKPEELLDDESFLTTAAKEKRDFFMSHLDIKSEMTPEELEKVIEPRLTAATKPLMKENESLKGEVGVLRTSKLSDMMEQGCRQSGILNHAVEWVKAWLRDGNVKWHEEYHDWFPVDEAGEFMYSAEPPKGGPPLKSLLEFLQEQRGHPTRRHWFDPEHRPGIEYKGKDHKVPAANLDEQIEEAEKKGEWNKAAELKQKKMDAIKSRAK